MPSRKLTTRLAVTETARENFRAAAAIRGVPLWLMLEAMSKVALKAAQKLETRDLSPES